MSTLKPADREIEAGALNGHNSEALAAELERLRANLDDTQAELSAAKGSLPIRLALRANNAVSAALPMGSRRRKTVSRLVRKAYHEQKRITDRLFPHVGVEEKLARHASRAKPRAPDQQHATTTFLALLLPGDKKGGLRTVASLQTQVHRQFALVSVPGLSAVNEAVKNSVADFVLFLNPGDRLTPSCLDLVRREVHRDPTLDLVYWDDAIAGSPRDKRFRPGWSPEMLLSANYLGNSFAVRRNAFLDAGGVREETRDAVLWDLLLRANFEAGRTIRIPKTLGYLKSRADTVTEDGRKVVEDECKRRGWDVSVVVEDGAARIVWLGEPPAVSIIIPTRHNRPLLEKVFAGLKRTDYPDFEVVVVDNGEKSEANQAWYAAQRLPLQVYWWEKEFNYSAVNNFAVQKCKNETLILLNDDIEVIDPGWLREMVGWANAPGIGAAGMQLLDQSGRIQHGGVVMGVGGFAGHLFQGLKPGDETAFGSTRWYRNTMAVTAACLAIKRANFDAAGGFDERFVLCGNDVALGLSLTLAGLRNVCTPVNGLRHAESATRGTDVPIGDFYASWWAYQPWLRGGDPYYSPKLTLMPGSLRQRRYGEPTALEMASNLIGRKATVFRSADQLLSASTLAQRSRASARDVEAVHQLHQKNREPFPIKTINWFLPGIDSPFYGGINTTFRLATYLSRTKGVRNRFIVFDNGTPGYFHKGITAAFPALEDSEVFIADNDAALAGVPPSDAAVATLWTTAYDLARWPGARRKFYMIQDFEPLFYPGGTLYALAEESYRLGLYGLCNTQHLGDIYRDKYGGSGFSFSPSVETQVFHNDGRVAKSSDEPVTVFVYARPGHWRNCWELAYAALAEVKQRLGHKVRIVAAGSWAIPEDVGDYPCIKQLGLLDYRATGTLYRQCDIGLALTVSEHPSYLPLELMACGTTVVAFDNPAGYWLLADGKDALLTPRTIDGLADAVERLVDDPELRARLASAATERIRANHSNWDASFREMYEYLSNPESL
jgi:GT2 family glycosyltransferase/glycosyltransferase involved in cell wall biosynthesis